MFRLLRVHWIAFFLLAVGAVSGCEIMPFARNSATTRAMWVTRRDFKTKEDCARIAEACEKAGFNTILFQVRGNATAFYRSSLEPWAEQFDYKDPGFDPLATMIEAAHAKGLKLHAWVNAVPAWYGLVPPADPNHVYNKHPEWMWYDQKGKRQPLTEKFYVSLNPCLPEVRSYLVAVMRDLVTHYSIDGLHLDYIRFPNEDPVIPPKSGLDYPRDAKTVALFRAATGKTPDKDAAAWNRWRTEQVTNLVRDIRQMMRDVKGSLPLSAAVGAVPENASTHYQDPKTWLAEGLVDRVMPMNYTGDAKLYEKRCEYWETLDAGRGRVVMGVNFEKADAGVATTEIRHALDTFGGYAVFAYASIFPSPNDAADRPDAESRAKRDALGKALLPLLQELARVRPAQEK